MNHNQWLRYLQPLVYCGCRQKTVILQRQLRDALDHNDMIYSKQNEQKVSVLLSKIKAARLVKRYSQEKVANELGITTTAYRKIETGQTILNIFHLYAIADVLEADAELWMLDMHHILREINERMKMQNERI